MGRLFGTDGVRGLANGELTADLVVRLSQSAAIVLTKGRHAEELKAEGRKPRAVIARDPRISGQFLSSAVSAGLAGSGIDVWDAGVVPTPAAAFLVRDGHFDFGVMVSASHNPAPIATSRGSTLCWIVPMVLPRVFLRGFLSMPERRSPSSVTNQTA